MSGTKLFGPDPSSQPSKTFPVSVPATATHPIAQTQDCVSATVSPSFHSHLSTRPAGFYFQEMSLGDRFFPPPYYTLSEHYTTPHLVTPLLLAPHNSQSVLSNSSIRAYNSLTEEVPITCQDLRVRS